MKFLKAKNGRLYGIISLTIGAFALVFQLCTLSPNQSGSGYLIKLTVDDKTQTEATFCGPMIPAFLSFQDSVSFDSIAWHLGAGKFVYPSITPGKKIKDVQVNLYWETMPLHKDTANKDTVYYDSIYVSLTGELSRSNPVRINVTNLPPVIDSVKINSTVYKSGDTLKFSVMSTDTMSSLLIKIGAHSLDKSLPISSLSCTWHGGAPRLTLVSSNQFNAYYQVPLFNCVDTIGVMVYDGLGGSDTRVIIIATQKNANRAPVIDSISAKDTLFSGSAGTYYYSSAKLDSIKFKVSAHDSDLGDALFYQWTNKNTKQVALRSVGTTMTLAWACTAATCRDTSSALKVVDTVTVSVRDNDSATVQKTIVIVKGVLGTSAPPAFDSLLVNDSLVKGSWSIAVFAATVRDTITFRMFAHDPDSLDTIHFKLSALDSQRIKKLGDTAATYVCKDSIYRDTILFHLYDLHLGYVDKKVVINVDNHYPVIDSVLCGDTLFKTTDSLYARKATGGDTLAIRIYARDPDIGDVLTDTLISASGMGVAKLLALKYQYTCPDSAFSDTLSAVVKDAKHKQTQKKIKINITKK